MSCFFFQGLLRAQRRPTVSYDAQGMVFAVAYGGRIRMFDIRKFGMVVVIERWRALVTWFGLYLTCYVRRGLLRPSLSALMIRKPMSYSSAVMAGGFC